MNVLVDTINTYLNDRQVNAIRCIIHDAETYAEYSCNYMFWSHYSKCTEIVM